MTIRNILQVEPTQLFTSSVALITLPMPMDIEWTIGDVIGKLRRKRRMNQTALGAKVGVNKATIVRAEVGDPKVARETYINIAAVLGTTLAELEMEAARLQGKGTQSTPSGAVFRRGTEERRSGTDRRLSE